MKILGKYSMGIGDRFGREGVTQLKAIMEAGRHGIEITPVWNKSDREHVFTGTHPADVRNEADSSTRGTGFTGQYFVDADHIRNDTVERFLEISDYFTIDIASYIGKKADDRAIKNFLEQCRKYTGGLHIPGIDEPFLITEEGLSLIAGRYLLSSIMAGEIYRKIEKAKGAGNFITEISMDEVSQPQSPDELFFMLKMISDERIPLQTIAPKFPGRFNKGVDFEGDTGKFALDFEETVMVIDQAVKEFGLPANLKVSLHSGSDKFSVYPHIGRLIRKFDRGIHVKTAGTTWLEEVIGLALSGGTALDFVREIYLEALDKIEELCAPYAGVISVDRSSLPAGDEVRQWDKNMFADSIRHIPGNRRYNPVMRQLMHVAYKLAAMRKDEFLRLLDKNEESVSQCVYKNIYDRHLCRIFDIR